MDNRIQNIEEAIKIFDNIVITSPFEMDDTNSIEGEIAVTLSNGETLSFRANIQSQYPYDCVESESIQFINKELREYPHVMGNGRICIHTFHETDINKKLNNDLNSLLEWAEKFVVRKEEDEHYEHLIIPTKLRKNGEFKKVFYFTDTEYKFCSYQYGFFNYVPIANSTDLYSSISNNVIKDFFRENKLIASSKWSKSFIPEGYEKKLKEGIYITCPSPPGKGKFGYQKWSDFENIIHPEQKDFIYNVFQEQKKKQIAYLPLLIGYNLPDNQYHWQVIIINWDQPPVSERHHIQVFNSGKIEWGETENCSYEYFFGRGTLNKQLTQAKILIIGVGAVGSILATTLTRGGATNLTLSDYDIKKPENICRSEYRFTTGNHVKVLELREKLLAISPFVNIDYMELFYWENKVKNSFKSSKFTEEENKIVEELNKYDYILDCSTDNSLMHILDKIGLSNVITISLTNKAKGLVCACTPKSYKWVMNQYQNILENDILDMYKPTGCWSPTFKASYNDIQTLVQYAIKQLNYKLEKGFPFNNFTLEIEENKNIEIKLKEY
ncbi:MAG: ThiF family adenylyltransferase [Prevotella sp.]|nr:ThiF family adenylyltransferase [Prevotella sp.]